MRFADFGKNFGKNIPSIYLKQNQIYLRALIKDIKKNCKPSDPVLIYDWGGGNGLIEMTLVKELKNFKKLRIVIFDLDKSKFIKHPKIKNVCGDLVKIKPKIRADYSIMKHVIHYNTPKNNKKIFENIYNSTKKKLLLINMYIRKDEISYYKNLVILLYDWFGIFRKWPTLKEILSMVKKSKFKLVYEGKILKKMDSINFYTRRYYLCSKQISILRDKNIDKIKTHKELILLCSK